MNVDFGAIIKRSFEVAWKYKTLWIFGLFAGGGSSFNLDFSGNTDMQSVDSNFLYDWSRSAGIPDQYIPSDLAVIGVLVAWLLALALLFAICYLIAQPAIIDGINKITRGGTYTFGTSFSRGADFFWRFFGLTLVGIFTGGVCLMVVVILAVIATPLSLLLTIPGLFVFGFFFTHTLGLAEISMVVRDIQIADAIAEGWRLVTTNKANCFLLSLIWIGMAIGFAIVFGIAGMIFYFPINLLVYGLTGNLVGILLLALFIGLPISLVLGGYTGTFFNSLYVQFYFQLVEPPQPIEAIPQTAG